MDLMELMDLMVRKASKENRARKDLLGLQAREVTRCSCSAA
jgi:hypothetical protein